MEICSKIIRRCLICLKESAQFEETHSETVPTVLKILNKWIPTAEIYIETVSIVLKCLNERIPTVEIYRKTINRPAMFE